MSSEDQQIEIVDDSKNKIPVGKKKFTFVFQNNLTTIISVAAVSLISGFLLGWEMNEKYNQGTEPIDDSNINPEPDHPTENN